MNLQRMGIEIQGMAARAAEVWTWKRNTSFPQQSNGTDCGMVAVVAITHRKQLWPVETTRVHTRNASWTLLYWSMLANAPDPLAADFGYVRDSKGRTAFAA